MPSTYDIKKPTTNQMQVNGLKLSDLNYDQMKNDAQSKINRNLTDGYRQSDAVQKSYADWQTAQASKPMDYKSTYTQQLDDLLGQVMNRPKFQYDVNQDALYRQARDLYMQTGRQAMKDTIGQASAMTGGYGNSYATSAGNQAYQKHLTQLAGMVPEYYDRALQAYNNEGDQLARQYQMLGQREGQDYDRYRDTVSDWDRSVDRALQTYSTLYGQDYGQYSDQLSNAYNALGAAENAQQWQATYNQNQQKLDMQQAQFDQQNASNIALKLLGSGQMPSADLLSAAGISAADAQSFISAWNAANAPKVTASSGSSGGPSKPKTTTNPGANTGSSLLDMLVNGVKGFVNLNKAAVNGVANTIGKNKYGSVIGK